MDDDQTNFGARIGGPQRTSAVKLRKRRKMSKVLVEREETYLPSGDGDEALEDR